MKLMEVTVARWSLWTGSIQVFHHQARTHGMSPVLRQTSWWPLNWLPNQHHFLKNHECRDDPVCLWAGVGVQMISAYIEVLLDIEEFLPLSWTGQSLSICFSSHRRENLKCFSCFLWPSLAQLRYSSKGIGCLFFFFLFLFLPGLSLVTSSLSAKSERCYHCSNLSNFHENQPSSGRGCCHKWDFFLVQIFSSEQPLLWIMVELHCLAGGKGTGRGLDFERYSAYVLS